MFRLLRQMGEMLFFHICNNYKLNNNSFLFFCQGDGQKKCKVQRA